MSGFADFIKMIYSFIGETYDKYIKMLEQTAYTFMGIIEDVLDISKIEAGKMELNNEPFNLKKTIDNIYNELLLSGNAKGLEVGFYLDPNIDYQIIGDELKLRQILSNLTNNAVKFTDRGYV